MWTAVLDYLRKKKLSNASGLHDSAASRADEQISDGVKESGGGGQWEESRREISAKVS